MKILTISEKDYAVKNTNDKKLESESSLLINGTQFKFWNWVFLTSNIRKIKSENKFFYEQFKAIITAWLLSSFEIQNNCTGQEIKRTHLHYTPKVYQILHLGYMFQTSQNFK